MYSISQYDTPAITKNEDNTLGESALKMVKAVIDFGED